MPKSLSRLRSRRPSPGTVISIIALIAALSGSAYAALARNSVGTQQLKRNAVVSSKVKDRSLKAVDFKRGQLPRGQRGPRGTRGLQGVPGPTASAFATADPTEQLVPILDFPPLITAENMDVPFAGRLIATATLEVNFDEGTTNAILRCRISIDGVLVGAPVQETFNDGQEVVTLTSAGTVTAGEHDVAVECISGGLANLVEFEGGNLTVVAAQE